MKTSVTNRIRFVLDEVLPAAIRNARWFMFPFFWVWFRGRHVQTAMDFKRLAPAMSEAELRNVVREVTNLGDRRPTDTHPEALAFVLAQIDGQAASLLDVGCGRGFFLGRVAGPRLLVGCDLLDSVKLAGARYVTASAERLPFADRAFDVVTCFHTLEHTRDLRAAVAELKRVARRQLIVIVPRQRFFFYTLDLHLQFFERPEVLEEAMGGGGTIRQFGSDLVYIAGA